MRINKSFFTSSKPIFNYVKHEFADVEQAMVAGNCVSWCMYRPAVFLFLVFFFLPPATTAILAMVVPHYLSLKVQNVPHAINTLFLRMKDCLIIKIINYQISCVAIPYSAKSQVPQFSTQIEEIMFQRLKSNASTMKEGRSWWPNTGRQFYSNQSTHTHKEVSKGQVITNSSIT